MAEQNSITTPEENVAQAPLPEGNKILCEVCGEMEEVRPGKKICMPCERMQMQKEEKEAARQELIEEKTTSKWLALLFEEAFAGIKSLCVILDDAEYDDTLAVLAPLVKHLETELSHINEVIFNTLGEIDILVCTNHMKVDGREYHEGDFYQALLEPKEARG